MVLGYFAIATNQTLCDFKRSIQVRYDATAAYLELLESGKRMPVPGFTIADVQADLAARGATLKSLEDLSCSP